MIAPAAGRFARALCISRRDRSAKFCKAMADMQVSGDCGRICIAPTRGLQIKGNRPGGLAQIPCRGQRASETVPRGDPCRVSALPSMFSSRLSCASRPRLRRRPGACRRATAGRGPSSVRSARMEATISCASGWNAPLSNRCISPSMWPAAVPSPTVWRSGSVSMAGKWGPSPSRRAMPRATPATPPDSIRAYMRRWWTCSNAACAPHSPSTGRPGPKTWRWASAARPTACSR